MELLPLLLRLVQWFDKMLYIISIATHCEPK